jgi:hypothetical protein
MNMAALPGHTNIAEHTFEPSTNACAVCHTNIAPDVLIANTHTEFSNRIDGVVSTLRRWALTAASEKLSSSKSNAWEYSTPGSLSVTNGAPAPSSANQVWIPSDIQKARFNVYLVAYDGSLGVHNSNYERHLLDTASNLVEVLIASTGTVSAAFSGLSPTSATNAADGTSTRVITLQSRDVNGKSLTVGGHTVLFSATLGSIGATTDNSNGTYVATWTAPSSTNGSPARVSATLNGIAVGTTISASNCVIRLTNAPVAKMGFGVPSGAPAKATGAKRIR